MVKQWHYMTSQCDIHKAVIIKYQMPEIAG